MFFNVWEDALHLFFHSLHVFFHSLHLFFHSFTLLCLRAAFSSSCHEFLHPCVPSEHSPAVRATSAAKPEQNQTLAAPWCLQNPPRLERAPKTPWKCPNVGWVAPLPLATSVGTSVTLAWRDINKRGEKKEIFFPCSFLGLCTSTGAVVRVVFPPGEGLEERKEPWRG